MNKGYIKLHRKFKDTSFFRNPNAAHLAVYLMMECTHAPQKFIFNNQEYTLNPGECITGRMKLSLETGLSEQEVRTSLEVLKNVDFLTSKSTNKNTRITIGNYEEYQSRATNNLTNEQPASNQPLTTYKNDKNEKNKEKAPAFVLPEWIDGPTWTAYLEVRKAKKATDTIHALNLIVAMLDRLRAQGHPPKDVLEKSIMSGWPGVYPLNVASFAKSGARVKPAQANPQYEEAIRNDKLIKEQSDKESI